MNVHDSERIKGLLESLGLGEATTPDEADVLVFNTCTIREKADDRLVAAPDGRPRGQAARPGQGDRRRRLLVGVDEGRAVRALPVRRPRLRPGQHPRAWATSSRPAARSRAATSRRSTSSPGDLPLQARPAAPGLAADLDRAATATARTASSRPCAAASSQPPPRRPGAPRPAPRRRRRARADAARPERELLRPRPAPGGARRASRELLRALDAVPGIDRIRYTSPHPKDMRDDVIAAHGRVRGGVRAPAPARCSRARRACCKAMRRTYSRERYLALVERIRDGDPRDRAHDRHHRRLPGRDRGRVRRDALGRATRSATTTPSRSSTRRGAAPTRRAWTIRCPRTSSRSASSGSSSSSSTTPPRATSARRHACRRCSSRARAAPTPRCCGAAPARTRRSTSRATRRPGELVHVLHRGLDVADAAPALRRAAVAA